MLTGGLDQLLAAVLAAAVAMLSVQAPESAAECSIQPVTGVPMDETSRAAADCLGVPFGTCIVQLDGEAAKVCDDPLPELPTSPEL